MADSKVYYQNERNDMFGYLPEKIGRSIEFGCSRGLFSKKVKENYQAEVWGIDIDPESVAVAATHLDRALAGDAMTLVKELPFNYFDCLICNDFLEHLARPDEFLLKVRPAMKKDAILIASVPNFRSWSNMVEILLEKDWRYKDSGILDKTHLRFFTLKSFHRFLSDCQLEIEVLQGTRPSSSKLFLLANILSFGFINDMKFSGIAARAKFIEKL